MQKTLASIKETNWIFCGLLLTITLVVYGRVIQFGLSGYDDWQVLRDSPIAHWRGWPGLLRFWSGRTPGELFFIPVSYSAFSLEHGIATRLGWDYFHVIHTVNLALHTGNTMLVFYFAAQVWIPANELFLAWRGVESRPYEIEKVGASNVRVRSLVKCKNAPGPEVGGGRILRIAQCHRRAEADVDKSVCPTRRTACIGVHHSDRI